MDVNHTPKRVDNEGATLRETTGIPAGSPPPRIAESVALQAAFRFPSDRVICTSIGRGQAARVLWKTWKESGVTLWYLDQFQQRLTMAAHADDQKSQGGSDARLSIVCSSDLPDAEFDLAVVPCSIRGEAELQRDLLQQAYSRLIPGGRLVSAVDNPKDRWLLEQLQELATKVTASRTDNAACYWVVKDKPLRRQRSFDCEFSFRDQQHTIRAVSRPGVFSHRHLDPGAKALLDAVHVKANDRIIDVGCGSGTVALALAMRASNVWVYAIDSNARAVECTRRGSALNGCESVVAALESAGACDSPASYDIAVCNPPYYSNFQIAKLFVDAARESLQAGGKAYFVTKEPEWYQENLYPGWRGIDIMRGRHYSIVSADRG